MKRYYSEREGLFKGFLYHLYNEGLLELINVTSSGHVQDRVVSNIVNFTSGSNIWTSESNPEYGQWAMIELKNHFIDISSYAIGYSRVNHPRSWDFSISMDGINWKIMHSLRESLVLNGTKGVIFKVKRYTARYLKWTNRGYNSDNRHFYVDNVDVYGNVIRCDEDCTLFPHFINSCNHCNVKKSNQIYYYFLILLSK